MEFLFENVNMISNRRGVNCNAQQLNFITSYFLNVKKMWPAINMVLLSKGRYYQKSKQTELRTKIVPTETSGVIFKNQIMQDLFIIC